MAISLEVRSSAVVQASSYNACPRRPLIDISMMTFHEWLKERRQQEGVLLNTDGRLKGLSPMNPLPKDSVFNKSLKQKPKALSSGVPTFKPWKAAQPARFVPYKPAQPAKVGMQKTHDT